MLEFGYPYPYYVVYWTTDRGDHSTTVTHERDARKFADKLTKRKEVLRVSIHQCGLLYEHSKELV